MTLALFHMGVTTTVLIGCCYLFIKERLPPHLTAMSAMAVLLITGVIDTDTALAVFSNSAPITIACMFVLSAALDHTGVVDAVGSHVLKTAERGRLVSLILLFGGVTAISAFMNNTPIVFVMAPVVIALARRFKDSPSKYLIPLSYAAILGGTCTLIGTSTNLLVDGVAITLGQPAFSMFEITLPGLCLATAGMLFMALLGHRLLPERPLLEEELIDESSRKRYFAEALIPHGSALIGKSLNEVQFTDSEDYEIIDLVRNDEGNRIRRRVIARLAEVLESRQERTNGQGRSTLRDIPLKAGDRLIFKTHKKELMELRKFIGMTFDHDGPAVSDPIAIRPTIVTEGVIVSNSRFIGQKPSQLRLRRRYGCYILAVHRDRQQLIHQDHPPITGNLDQLALQEGDILLLEGPKKELNRLMEFETLIPLTQLNQKSLDKPKAAIAVTTILMVVGLAALNVMPIAGLAIAGAVLVLLTGCVSQQRAYEAIEWRILLLIFGMLALSQALEQTGVIKLMVEAIASAIADLGPWAVLTLIYLMTSLLTEIMSNNAAAVLLTPIAVGLANSMGVDPRPFIVAVMFGASASFATPIGYQTNTYVYNAGNYRFSDFLRVGIPMNLLMLITAIIVIPLFFDF